MPLEATIMGIQEGVMNRAQNINELKVPWGAGVKTSYPSCPSYIWSEHLLARNGLKKSILRWVHKNDR